MQLFQSLLAGAALVAAAVAQDGRLSFTSFPEDVSVGEPVTVTWAGGIPSEPVTITLRRGVSDNLDDVAVLTSTATGGSYTWDPSEDLADGEDYALMISQGEEVNYTNQFSIEGGSGSDSPSGSETTGAATDSASITLTLSSATPSTTDEATTTTEAETSAVTTSAPSTSGFSTITPPRNTTSSEPTLSSTLLVTNTPSPTSPSETTPADPDSAASSAFISSPLALIVTVLAAIAYFN